MYFATVDCATLMLVSGHDPVAGFMANRVEADGFFLEYDDARSGDFRPLRFVPKGKAFVFGLVSSNNSRTASPDELKWRIDEASRFAPIERLALRPECGFAISVRGNKITQDEQWRKLALVVNVAIKPVYGRRRIRFDPGHSLG